MATAEVTTREQWLAERMTGIGGSDAAPAVGLSEYRTPLEVYNVKLGIDVVAETPDMVRGRMLEPALRQWYCNETGREIVTPDGIVRHPQHPWLIASPDGLSMDGDVVAEFKTARMRRNWGEPGTAEVPIDYLCQVQHYMLVTGRQMAEIGVLFGDLEFCIYFVPADAEFQAMLFDAEAAFWERVQARVPPEPINIADIRRRWPVAFGKSIEATPEIIAACDELSAVREQLSELERREEALRASVQSFMQDHDTLRASERVLATWKSAAPSRRFDANRFAKEHSEAAAPYMTETKPQRRFLLKSER